ncbi:flavin reductase [Cryobacterium sp. TMT1-2-2]|uniref:flavin reductase family protein n=1 Tax=Cryobacterium sp. TMT1-2-2 TaxID=1259233 RepID=UPI00106B1389|nr:flavin reductase family protein [Cryobacterium sp. TMT1-2-2]TFD12231.1 flavin reductase [Cryobacterium sp. TMT1-2-2]
MALLNSLTTGERSTIIDIAVMSAELRDAMRHWVTGVTVITTSWRDQTAGLVSNSFTSVSLEPALVSWCIDLRSSSLELWNHTDNFAVHVLDEEQTALAARFAKKGGDKFSGMDWTPGICGSPMLAASPLALECEVWARYQGGDHLIVVGRVIRVTRPESFAPLTNHALYH